MSPENSHQPEPAQTTATTSATVTTATTSATAAAPPPPVKETGGVKGPEPTRYGDWERNGRCCDF